MKTVKLILPVLAIVAAVAGVFATGNSAPAITFVDVSAMDASSGCIKDGRCDTDDITYLCTLPSGVALRATVSGDCDGIPIPRGKFIADQPLQ